MTVFRIAALVLSLTLTGCAHLRDEADGGEVGIDGQACTGRVMTTAPGLAEAGNPPLRAKAQMPSGKGGVCAAKVFSSTAPVVLYRVFDASKPYSKLGSWWSLELPRGSRDDYRAANAICPEWSQLDRLVACEVRPGTQIVVGTTQSAECGDGSTYPKTAVNQVFVPNDGKVGIVHVGACSEEKVWP